MNKVAAIVTGTIITLTAGILPSYALNGNQSLISITDTNLKTVPLNNAFNQNRNNKLLIARRRRRRTRKVCKLVLRSVTQTKKGIVRRTVRKCRYIRK